MEIKFRFRLKLIVDNWGTYKKGDIDTFIIPLLGEQYGLVRFGIDKQWEIISCDRFIGDTDREGEDIFENDILIDTENKIGAVEFFNGSFCLKSKGYYVLTSGFLKNKTKVGNAYDTPEFLQI